MTVKPCLEEKGTIEIDGALIEVKRPDDAWVERVDSCSKLEGEKGEKAFRKLYMDYILGWKNFIYKGKEVPFSKKNLKKVFEAGDYLRNRIISGINSLETFKSEGDIDFDFDLSD